MEDVAVVVDGARAVAGAIVEEAGALQEAVAFEPEVVGDPPRHDAARDARALEPLDPGGDGAGAVVVVHHAGEHTGSAAPQRGHVDAGTLAHLPRRLEEQPLLRVHRQRLPRRDAEEPRVELACVGEETAFTGVARAGVVGVGVETADMLVHEVLSRNLRDRRAVARYAGLTGAPDESGRKRREKGLAKAGNSRVRHEMVQLAWRFLLFQRDSALACWYRARTADARGATRKTMIVALARKLLVGLWQLATTGKVPEGLVLRPA